MTEFDNDMFENYLDSIPNFIRAHSRYLNSDDEQFLVAIRTMGKKTIKYLRDQLKAPRLDEAHQINEQNRRRNTAP